MDQAPINEPMRAPVRGAGAPITRVLQGTAVIAPLVSIYAPLFMAPLLLIAALGIGLSALFARHPVPVLGRPLLMLLGLIVLWGALSSLWSIAPKASVMTSLQLLALFTSGAVVLGGVALLDGAQAARIGRWLVIGMIAALVVYTIEITLDSPIQSLIRERREAFEGIYSPFNRGLAVLALLLPPAALALRRGGHRLLALGLLAATIAIVYLYYGSSIAVGVTCGIVAGTLSFFGRGAMIRLIGWLVAVMILVAPYVAREAISPTVLDAVGKESSSISVPHRLVIWRFVATKALEQPLIGWGLDAARAFPEGKTTAPVTTLSCQPPCSTEVEQLPLHPHNMVLQWWLELGLPGAALGAMALLWLFYLIPRLTLDRVEQGLLAGQLTAGIAIAGLSYGAWQSWWLATLALAMSLSAAVLRAKPVAASVGSFTETS
jgi:O-antigen ligase